MLPSRGSSGGSYSRMGGQHTPDLDFFDSENFWSLESTHKRHEVDAREEMRKARRERSRRTALVERSFTPEIGYYSQMFRADGNPKPKSLPEPPHTFYGLRRPLNAQDQRVVAALPAYEKDHKEWVDKPYSTVYTGQFGYTDSYPLLMQINSEAEDKDVTVIQTETRRKSLVTTNYASATIELVGDSEEIKFAVFPILHRVVESDDEDDDDDEFDNDDDDDDKTGEENEGSMPKNRPPPLLPQDMLDRLATIAGQNQDDEEDEEDDFAEPPPGWLEHRNTRMHTERRLSITTRPCPEKPRMLKRRSLDYGSLFYHHEIENMDTIGEDNEESQSGTKHSNDNEQTATTTLTATMGSGCGPRGGTWAMESEAKERDAAKSPDLAAILLRAEKDMEQMDYHLHKLEEFLEGTSSDESVDQ